MTHEHRYTVSVDWTGNRGEGTSGYRVYGRDSVIRADGKLHPLATSADPSFFGDPERWNPEELLLASLAQCHLLSYLYVAAQRGIVVVDYRDEATGVLEQLPGGRGRFTEATLRPQVTIAAGTDAVEALAAHQEAAALCFIAASVAFPVHHEPRVAVRESSAEG